ncbi:MAG: CDP-alcohol phosphatidyltransferase family protein, partial [Candidatus Nanopelagicales bacterium]
LLLIPLFVWLALVPEADGWAFTVLAVSAITDYLDGKIARHYQIVSRVGQLLDPIADRLFVISTILVLAAREIVPWWLVLALVARDLFMGGVQLYMRRHQLPPLPVHYVGKAATVCLLFALPTLMLTTGDGTLADIALPLAWAFIGWGLAIYWWSAVLYAEQAHAIVNGRRLEVSA